MADDSPPDPSPPHETPFSPRSTSFIYPVRSLLGTIQPAIPTPRSKSVDELPSLDTEHISDIRPSSPQCDAEIADQTERQGADSIDASPAQTAEHVTQTFELPAEASYMLPSLKNDPHPHSSSYVPSLSHLDNPGLADSTNPGESIPSVPNFRHFPAEEGDPNVPRTFSTRFGTVAVPQSQIKEQESILAYLPFIPILTDTSTRTAVRPPSPAPPSTSTLPLEKSTNSAASIKPLSQVDHDKVLVSGSTDASLLFEGLEVHGSSYSSNTPLPAEVSKVTPASESADDTSELPFNISQYGLVHLPPLPFSGPSGRRTGSDISNRSSSVAEDLGPNTIPAPTPGGASTSYSENVSGGPTPTGDSDFCESDHTPSSMPPSTGGMGSGFDSSTGSEPEELVTLRFQYVLDEHGNHVVVGREGQLKRCEDEPIRTPGAVQGFGVLIAVEDLENTLVVRQVSENSTELLGLSPRYLFSLECFTDTLPESSAGSLWENIQFLTDSACPVSEQEDNAPHVFTLSGWGEPGSAPAPNGSWGSCPFQLETRRSWACWCAVHRVSSANESKPGLIVMEFELEADNFNPLYPLVPVGGRSSPGGDTPSSATPTQASTRPPAGLEEQNDWTPGAEDILESTTNCAKPIPALQRLRRLTQYHESRLSSSPSSSPLGGSIPSTHPTSSNTARTRRRGVSTTNSGAVGMMDVFAVMTQVNQQMGAAQDLDTFLKVTVGVIKDLTQFHRVLVYQFDEVWNGQVVAELVDWGATKDLYKGLHFPAGDIPKQARELYIINKVRVLYDRSQLTARIVVKDKADLKEPLDMTHCYLRAMSPIHLKYLENMGVRASMSISIMAFDRLWGLVACHSYGDAGMRVSFPMRQMLRPLSQSISRNIERLSYAKRLHTRKLINALASDRHSTGYIVSHTDDLLGLFDADYSILVIGEGAKILGPNQHGQEILIMAEYLRLKRFDTIQASQAVISDFPDLRLTTGFEVIAGLLYVPLSSGGKDFIAFLRRGQLHDVHWAGKSFKNASHDAQVTLEPRKSFKIWSETIAGRCRAWTDEQLDTAGVLALVCRKFIEVWRQKQSALQATKLTNLLLSNAAHEVRTPLNHIINYLEMAINSPLDNETRDNLVQSHAASKSLLFAINDLLDLARLESGNETSFNEPFDFHAAIENAVHIYQTEASRRNIDFVLDLSNSPKTIVGDSRKIRTVVQNLTANALKCTEKGSISVSCKTLDEHEGFRSPKQSAVEVVVADAGCGIEEHKLANIFREFERFESSEPWSNAQTGVGLGLAVVARIIDQLGSQLCVDSQVGVGSRFSFLIPLVPSTEGSDPPPSERLSGAPSVHRQAHLHPSSEIEDLVEALSFHHAPPRIPSKCDEMVPMTEAASASPRFSGREAEEAGVPAPPLEAEYLSQEIVNTHQSAGPTKLRILIIEDNDINLAILAKRLTTTGHTVVKAANGQEGIDIIKSDDTFDAILMDIQMPIMDGFEATRRIRTLERDRILPVPAQRMSQRVNGRIPILAVSASLVAQQREELINHGMDGWILKPINFKRLHVILKGVTDVEQRKRDVYHPDHGNWEAGGWLQNTTDVTQSE